MKVFVKQSMYNIPCIVTVFSALTEHHLRYLLEDTFDAQKKWRFIGLYLGLTHSMLSAIKANNPSFEERYTEMLARWINIGSATVKRLIDALEANTVQMKDIAKRLREKYAEGFMPHEGMTGVLLQAKHRVGRLYICRDGH